MATQPRKRTQREYESRLHDFRVKQQLTVVELAEAAETNVNMIVGLANGSTAPTDREGHIKPVVARISEVLDTPVEDLFPRYFCKLLTSGESVTLEQLVWSLYVQYTPDQVFDIKEFNQILELELDQIELDVIKARYFQGESLRDASAHLPISEEYIRTVEARALRKLRRPSSSMRHFDRRI